MNPNWSIPLVLLLGISTTWAQSSKSKPATSTPKAESKKDTGPSLEETQSFIKEKIELWGNGKLEFSINKGDITKMEISTTISFEGSTLIINQKTHKFFMGENAEGRALEDTNTSVNIRLNCNKAYINDIQLESTCIVFKKNLATEITEHQKLNFQRYTPIGEDTIKIPPRDWHPIEQPKQGIYYMVGGAEPDRLIKAFRRLLELNGNKTNNSPF